MLLRVSAGVVPPPSPDLRYTLSQAIIRGVIVLLALLLAGSQQIVRAQFGSVHPNATLRAGERVNVYIDWQGTRALEGVSLDLPGDWRLVEVDAIPERTNDVVSFRVEASEQTAGRMHAYSPRSLRGPHQLILGLTVGQPSETATIDIMPMRRREDGQLMLSTSWERVWGPTVARAVSGARGRALRTQSARDVAALSRSVLPRLGHDEAFTVEVWIKTTGRGEVILSTWDAQEYQGYPLEWLVDVRGRLVAFRGEPNQHVGMRSTQPVADGLWHHVAISHDPANRRARLFVDGEIVDSLRVSFSSMSDNLLPVVVGGRRTGRAGDVQHRYTGYLDELRFWDRARSREEIQYTMRQQLENDVEGMVRLGFDTVPDPQLLDSQVAQRALVRSDLSFSYPIESLTADVEETSVRIFWETKDRENERFTVERSSDGRTFTAVGRVRLQDRIAEAADGTMRFAFTDVPPDTPLLYYRIRQHFAETSDRLSAAMKLGLGADGAPLAVIHGNSPNPFSSTTTVSFELQRPSPVRLSVWDVSGSSVAVLVDGSMSAGPHEVRFDARDLPSGIYFVQLQTDQTRLTHKITLAR
ncbi:MAG: LamG-like jellyroll fold domain-containing protein [Rubricoccaceae bacterium]|nr:LamG-like jellyroll fold domain-containing protein [Rubricoccaceae bacterium]